ncbi:hypothetical protein ACN2WE_40850 [Streptomyces sp. cg28]|uniref:hypothetical protein n=1 Tax=Streptomyces sp. cg28 TaxID=3403457 RepID=UPI003B20FB5F
MSHATRRVYELVTSPMLNTEQRKLWSLFYQRVVGLAFSEVIVAGGLRRLDILARDGTKVELQQARDSRANADGKSLMHSSGVMWVFCVINQHFKGRFRITSVRGARATFAWNGAWDLVTFCHGRVLLDLGFSPQLGTHVLLEVDQREVDGKGQAYGSGVLRDAQDFCRWMKEGTPLPPYYPNVAQSA